MGNTINLSAVETYTVTSNGTYYVNLTVRDDASNINSTLFTVYVDQSAPVINNLSINSLTSSSATLTVNASDIFSGIYNCNYSNAGNGSLTLSGGLYTATLSGLNASTTYIVNVTCYDKTGYFVSNTHNFTTNAVFVAQSVVNLGTASDFVILAKSGISTTGTTTITGDIGVSPAAASYITGFGLVLNNTYATSSLITGNVYAANYAPPTPAMMTTAVSNMETAYTDAAGRTNPYVTELGAGNIGGMTLLAGLYKWSTGVTIPTDVTLSGNSSDVWIFQIAQTLDISNGKKIILSGGANASNIFWQVAGQTTLGTTSVFNGNILDQTAIVLNTGATLNGKALSQTAVTLDASTVLFPITVNEIPPTTFVVNPGSSWINTNFNFTLNATGYTNVSYINYTLNNVSHQINSSFYEVLINDSGNYTLTYYAVDLLGNIESSKTIYILLDKLSPNITSFILSSSSVHIGDTITSICTATDNLDSNPSIVVTGIDTSTLGSKTATCTATDAAGNVATTNTDYTVNTVSSGGSGGGGGGGSFTQGPEGYIGSASHEWDTIDANSVAIMSINNPQIAVTEISFDVVNTLTKASLQVYSLSENPTSTQAAPKTYQYLQIDTNGIDSSDVSSILVNFAVPNLWMSLNNIEKSNIILYRYHNGQWEALSTTKIGEEGSSQFGNTLYQTILSDFNSVWYAIGNNPYDVTTTTSQTSQTQPTSTSTTNSDNTNENTGTVGQENNTSTQLAQNILPNGNLLTGAVISGKSAMGGLFDTIGGLFDTVGIWWNQFTYWITHLFV